jgi:hypothetical protein
MDNPYLMVQMGLFSVSGGKLHQATIPLGQLPKDVTLPGIFCPTIHNRRPPHKTRVNGFQAS